jgi:hypothetical protein
LEIFASHLKSFALRNGQCLPTSEGTGRNGEFEHRVLPYYTQVSAREALEAAIFADTDVKPTISSTMFQRALAVVQKQYGLTVGIKKGKSLAKCHICAGHLKSIDAVRNDKPQYEIATRLFNDHTDEWREQRHLFDSKKQLAMQRPWDLVTCTWDGMDMMKNKLPHVVRHTNASSSEKQIQLRVVGMHVFGGVFPVMGYTSYPNVVSKGANASCAVLMETLERMYAAQDASHWAAIPGVTFDFALCERENPAFIRPMVHESSNDIPLPLDESPPKVLFMWPKGFHFTFDNTSGDTKNTTSFMFFAQLVALGVVQYITVSTLMVGHTHDIVDQMFSCWSRALSTQDAPTLTKMFKLFREKYSTNSCSINEDLRQRIGRCESNISDMSSAQTVMERPTNVELPARILDVAATLGVEPVLINQTVVPDLDGWIPSGSTLKDISKPHVFYLVREKLPGAKHESVVMYSRFLANSCTDASVQHNRDDSRHDG